MMYKTASSSASSLLRATAPKLLSSSSSSISRTFAYPPSFTAFSSRATFSAASRSFRSSVLRWSHRLHCTSPLSLRPQIRAVAPAIERFHRKIATMGFLLLLPSPIMDAGFSSSREHILRRKNSRENIDRFIPNRSAMDFGYAHCMLTERRKEKENTAVTSPSREAYRKKVADALDMNRTRILAFKNKPPKPVELIPKDILSPPPQSKSSKPMRHMG